MLAHVVAHLGPHGEQGALALVVAGAVLVRLAEVADDDRPVDGATMAPSVISSGGRAST